MGPINTTLVYKFRVVRLVQQCLRLRQFSDVLNIVVAGGILQIMSAAFQRFKQKEYYIYSAVHARC